MSDETSAVFSEDQRLLLHQLRLREWLNSQHKKTEISAQPLAEDADEEDATIPRRWQLTRGITLYDWQEECINRWFDTGHRGTVKVVTGVGKTLLGLAIAERLQHTVNPRLRVAVVVPTVVLMHQWYDELLERGNLPPHAIGRLGGGYREDLKDGKRILIAVLASARKQLAELVRSSRNGRRLILIADECHRAGAVEMSNIFETPRAYNLGLSATPEREEDSIQENASYGNSLLGQELGPIIYEFTLAQALKLGIIPPFTIRHYGLPLTPEEQSRYDQLSRAITDVQTELRPLAPAGRSSGSAFFQWLHSIAGKDAEAGALAARLVAHIARRQDLLQGIQARGDAVATLLRREFAQNLDSRAILFHESIDEVMKLFLRLQGMGFRVIAEHSRLPESFREEGLNLFRQGIAQIIVSARSLIEGFNVPAVDIGIIVASSGSIRQRIQSLGRVLRRHRGPHGEEKTSSMHILYARGTVDDQIYARLDWDRATGVEQNIYVHWDIDIEPVVQPGPPRRPLPSDVELDAEALKPGKEYPGAYEGSEYRCDTHGNIQNDDGTYARNSGDLVERIVAVKGSAGRFRITPMKKYVLVRVPRDQEWVTLYVTRLQEALEFQSDRDAAVVTDLNIDEWVHRAAPGDLYPFSDAEIVEKGLRFSARRNGLISRKVSQGEAFARFPDRAQDLAKGEDAKTLVHLVHDLRAHGIVVSQLEMNVHNHVLYRQNGRLHFLYALKAGLEFPEL
jgi:superfamily II DNA or RNA helicase